MITEKTTKLSLNSSSADPVTPPGVSMQGQLLSTGELRYDEIVMHTYNAYATLIPIVQL